MEAGGGTSRRDNSLAKALILAKHEAGGDLKLLSGKGETSLAEDKDGRVWFLFCGSGKAKRQNKGCHSVFPYQ